MKLKSKKGENYEYMSHRILNWLVLGEYNYTIIRFVLQEMGILLGGCCLTCEELV